MKSLKNMILPLGTSLAVLIGVGAYSVIKDIHTVPRPVKEKYEHIDAYLVLPESYENGMIIDADNDGDADLIKYAQPSDTRVLAIAPDMVKSLKRCYAFDNGRQTARLTPEMRSLATRILQEERELAYLLHKQSYDAQQEQRK